MKNYKIKVIRELCEKTLNPGEMTDLISDLMDIVIINKRKEKI